MLLRDKANAPEKMIYLCKKLQVEKGTVIARIRNDHGREFENTKLATFCNESRHTSRVLFTQDTITKWNSGMEE